MALKALMLRKKIDDCNKALEELRSKKEALTLREAELEQSIAEAETEEERATVEEAVEAFEADKAENESKTADFSAELEKLEAELKDEEERQAKATKTEEPKTEKTEKREEIPTMTKRFFGMDYQQRTAFLEREDVKAFLERVKDAITNKRAVTGASLFIPTVVLDLIRQNIEEYSKLYKHVNVKPVPGKARQNITGVIPEAVWTEMCANLNELSINFYGVEVDGYKVGGYVPLCNAMLEDSQENLASEIINQIGAGIGFALDKAIIYGTGTKMPVGIFTRLAQTSDPSDPRTTIPWADLHSTNIITIANTYTGSALFQQIILATGAASGKYARKPKFWAMNEKTQNSLKAESLAFNAAGAIVASAGNEMPIVGGAIETLDFIPDDVIIGGYGELYLLAERQGGEFAQSEHVRFINDQTVFKGTARYDGLPVIAEGFVAIGIKGETPSASGITFAEDSANP